MSGRFTGQDGTLIAEDPPLASEGTFTNAQLDTLFTNIMPCMCHHTNPASKARDLLTWWQDDALQRLSAPKKDAQGQYMSALAPNGAKVIHPIIREAMLGSMYCGNSSCREVMNVLKDFMFAMQTSGAGTCSWAHASQCVGGGTDSVCLTPDFGPKSAQKFPLRWFNMKEMVYRYSSQPELAYLDDRWLYWEACAATTECSDDVTIYKIVITFTIDATIETFDAAAFKSKLAAFLNKDDATAGLVSANDISLEVTSGSIKVKATIETPLESVKDSVVLTLKNANTADLSKALGVTVLEKSVVTVEESIKSGKGAAGSTVSPGILGAIIAGGAAFLALVIVIIAIVFWKIRKKKAKETDAKDVTIVVDGKTVANDEAEVEVAASS